MLEDRSLDRAIAGKDKSQDRREVNIGIDRLVENSLKHRSSKDFQEMIGFMGKFREYAPYNNMLVRGQNPSCSFYATASDWQKRFKRSIKEDTRPMLILAPMHPVMLVYDVDQTEGKDLPSSLTEFSKFHGELNDNWLEKLTDEC